MLGVLSVVVDWFAPLFLVASPVTSYADQILSIHRIKSSDGFSLDIPCIMLIASILKVFYWFGEYYSTALLLQACLMIGVQLVLLKVALDNRPASGAREGLAHVPFSGYSNDGSVKQVFSRRRPFDFWRWASSRQYYLFLAYLTGALFGVHVLLPMISQSPTYLACLGYFGLAVEAMLPVPQILKNHHARSCKGFRLSVIINWLAGDAMKMSYFFLSKDLVPWPFRLCGMFQACCDCYLGLQFYMYGAGSPASSTMEMTHAGKGAMFG